MFCTLNPDKVRIKHPNAPKKKIAAQPATKRKMLRYLAYGILFFLASISIIAFVIEIIEVFTK